MSELQQRLDLLLGRLRSSYDSIGHSSGRPYVYFVYPPDREKMVFRMIDDATLSPVGDLAFIHIDLLHTVMQATAGQEERREVLLDSPDVGKTASSSLMRLWAREVGKVVASRLAAPSGVGRPVVVFRGLAALHPLGNPTGLMELLAEKETRDPETNRVVPIVILVPGERPPQTSRTYNFLGRADLQLDFYRGEEA
jgi:hypothetical protein